MTAVRATCLVVLLVAASLAGATGGALAAADPVTSTPLSDAPSNATPANGSVAKTDATPNVSDALLDAGGPATASVDGSTGASERVTAVFETHSGAARGVADAVRGAGGSVSTVVSDAVEARVPRAALRSLAARPDVTYVRRPYRPQTAAVAGQGSVVSDGLDNMNVTALHENGVTGENTTVAVVGLEFNASNPEIADHVTETKSFGSDGGFDASNTHGTAVAELVADTAPNASIVLVEIDSLLQFREAANWVDEGANADVAVASLGWTVGPFDGETRLGDQIRQGTANGTQWVVSAGNSGDDGHLNTTWHDGDGDGWLNFDGGSETAEVRSVRQSGYVTFEVNWDEWPRTSNNYDAYLYADNGTDWTLVDSSTRAQTGTQPPYESLRASGYSRYALRIYSASANGTADFDVFTNDGTHFVTHGDRYRSVTRPATVDAVLAVGAVNEETNDLEAFSSRGPTIDGRLKPDLVAPDAVDTSVPHLSPFYGTSAAAPHAAGAVALLADASDGRLSPAELRERLSASARPIDSPTPNDRTGYGLLDAEAAVDALATVYRDHCAIIDAGGRNVLTSDLASSNGTCVRLTGDDAALDGRGRAVTAPGDAVRVAGATNVTVRDAVLRGAVGLNATRSAVSVRNATVEAGTALRAADGTRLVATDLVVGNATLAANGTDYALAAADAPNETLERAHAGPYVRVGAAADGDPSNSRVTLTLPYDGAATASESALELWAYDGSSWRTVGGRVNASADTVTATFAPGTETVTLYRGRLPNATYSARALDFGDVRVGANATRTVAVRNDGGAPLNVTGLETTADAYAVADGFRGVLPVGANATVALRFAPERAGAGNATLRVASNDSASPDSLALRGVGVAPAATVTPARHDFGNVTRGAAPSATFTVSNTGNRPLELENATLVGDASAFALSDASLPTTLEAGAATTLNATFAPERVGTANATLVVAHNGTDGATNATLTGTLPPVALNATALDFGAVEGNETRTRALAVTNQRASALRLSTVEARGDAFALATVSNRTLAPGERSRVVVAFAPSRVGAAAGTLALDGTDDGRPVSIPDVALAGERVDATPPTVSDFGANATGDDVVVGLTSTEALATLEVVVEGPESATLERDDFTAADGRYTATVANVSDGTYALTLRAAEDAAGNDGSDAQTASVTVDTGSTDGTGDRGDTGGSGGTGGGFVGGFGGGGAGAPSDEPSSDDAPSVETTPTASGVNATVRNATADAPVALNFSSDAAAGANTSVSGLSLSLEPAASDTFSVAVGSPAATPPDGTPALTGARAHSYFTVEPTLADAAVAGADVRFEVSPRVRDAGNVTLYRYHDGSWRPLETTRVAEDAYRAHTPGFSAFAVATPESTRVTDAAVGLTETSVGGPIPVRVTVANDGPATTRTVAVRANGSVAGRRDVSLDAHATTTVTLRVALLEAGTYDLTVGNRSAGTVTVYGDARTNGSAAASNRTTTATGNASSSTPRTTGGGSPGLGAPAALAAFALAVLALARRRRR